MHKLILIFNNDTAQPTVVAISCTSSWTSKVNSIHYAFPIHNPLNGLLPHTPSCDYARCDLMSTGAWEEATSIRGLKADVREAWKRRRKKTSARWPESPPHTSRSLRPSRSIRRTPAGYSARPASTSTRPRVTRLGCPDRILPGDYPESPPPPDTPACAHRILRPKMGLRAWNGPSAHVPPLRRPSIYKYAPRSWQHPFPLYVAYI